ncbi:hypothetical protein [Clostridium folliculivorans]|nr:hypothetical protein [Clostridium folliculivorans]
MIEWIFMDIGSTFVDEEQCDNYRIMYSRKKPLLKMNSCRE